MDHRLKRKFEDLYRKSPPIDRALFDNPETRNQVPDLNRAYVAYQSTDNRRRKKTKRPFNMQAEAEAAVGRELDNFLFGLEVMAKALDYHFRNSAPES